MELMGSTCFPAPPSPGQTHREGRPPGALSPGLGAQHRGWHRAGSAQGTRLGEGGRAAARGPRGQSRSCRAGLHRAAVPTSAACCASSGRWEPSRAIEWGAALSWSLKCWHHGGDAPQTCFLPHRPPPRGLGYSKSFKFPHKLHETIHFHRTTEETERGVPQTGPRPLPAYHPASLCSSEASH